MQKVLSAPRTYRKAGPAPRITECIHVLKGGVWCIDCASTFRSQSREIYARALRESKNSSVIQAAQIRLSKALQEYALTPAGIEELERDYVRMVAEKRTAEAEKIREQITKLSREVSERNKISRRNELYRQARMNTANAPRRTIVTPPFDSNGSRTTENVIQNLTTHARERMELRGISFEQVTDAFKNFDKILPRGNGSWGVYGKNKVTLYGSFEKKLDGKIYYITATVFCQNPENEAGEENGNAEW